MVSKSIATPTGKVEWGNFLRGSLSACEDEDAANYDRGDTENRCDQSALLCRNLERADFNLVAALRVRDSAHRDDDDAANYQKHSDPTEWPHDHSAKGLHILPYSEFRCKARSSVIFGPRRS